jgi:hypothetical protein
LQRRELLRTLGAAAGLALIPHRDALAAWSRVASGLAVGDGLSDPQLALVAAIADTNLPRTDSPSATDVRVPQFINVIVSENYSESERAAFVSGLALIESNAQTSAGASFTDLQAEARASFIQSIESLPDRRGEPGRTWWRLKGLVIHGYFTSEPVMKNVLHVEVMPGHFDGNAPMPNKVILAGHPRHG